MNECFSSSPRFGTNTFPSLLCFLGSEISVSRENITLADAVPAKSLFGRTATPTPGII